MLNHKAENLPLPTAPAKQSKIGLVRCHEKKPTSTLPKEDGGNGNTKDLEDQASSETP